MVRPVDGPSDYEILATEQSWENEDKTSQPVPPEAQNKESNRGWRGEGWGQGERLCSDERRKESNTLICLTIHQQFSKGYQMNVPNRERWIVIRHVNVLTTQFDQF